MTGRPERNQQRDRSLRGAGLLHGKCLTGPHRASIIRRMSERVLFETPRAARHTPLLSWLWWAAPTARKSVPPPFPLLRETRAGNPTASAPVPWSQRRNAREERRNQHAFRIKKIRISADHFYNIKADLPELPKPPLNPRTQEPFNPSDLEAIFSKGFIRQEDRLSGRSPSPTRSSRPTPSSGRRPSSTPRACGRPSTPPPASSTSMRASGPSAATRRTRPSCRPISPPRRASRP